MQAKKETQSKQDFLERLDGLAGLTVLKIALKELNLIKSQKAGLITAFTLAIVVMGTLALAFGGNASIGKVDVALFAPSTIKDFDTDAFVSSLSNSGNIVIHSFDSREEVLAAIKNGKCKVGIALNNPETKSGRYVIDLYYDNSSLASSEFFFEIAKTQIQNIGFSMSQEIIKKIWGDLGEINAKLGSEVSRIDEFIARLDESEAKLNDLEKDLNALSVSDAKSALGRQGEKVQGLNAKLSEVEIELDSFIATVDEINSQIGTTKGKIGTYRTEIHSTLAELQVYSAQLDASKKQLESAGSLPGASSAINTINQALGKINGISAKLSSIDSDLALTETQLSGLDSKINQPQTGIKAKLLQNKQEIQSLKSDVAGTSQDLNQMNSFVTKLDSTVKEVKELIANSKAQKRDVESKLQESKKMLSSFTDSLKDLSKISPDFLANPLILNKIQAFAVQRLGIAVPIALVLLLMLTTILLTGVSFVDERNQGAYSRMVLSTTSKPVIFAGKILGQLIFALIQAAIIVALLLVLNSFTPYKITIIGSLLDVFIGLALVSFAFITWGLLIANFTKNQGTTILMSLLFIVPMLFLSGTLIPLELINPAIQGIAQVLPLTVSMNILSAIMVKGLAPADLPLEIAILLIPAFAILALTLANKRLK